MSQTGRLVVAISGASGAIYGVRFLRQAVRHFAEVYLMVSDQAIQVMRTELDLPLTRETLTPAALLGEEAPNLTLLGPKDYFTPPASGSFRHDGMVIVPCSMGAAGRIANGVSNDLMTRAADVCLKERRRLVLVVRETPWSLIHLRNLTQLAEAGATILPASPGFYHRPQTVEQLADSVVGRILNQLGIDHRVTPQWQYEETE